MFRKTPFRPVIILITLFVAGAASTAAQPFAQVGVVHPDGTVQLDESRFTPWISTTPETGEPLGETVLGISNGLAKVVRTAQDQCTSEEMQLYFAYSIEESFTPLQAGLGTGEYPNGSQVAETGHSGPVYVLEEEPASFLYECADNGCNAAHRGACLKLGEPNPGCACVWAEGLELHMGGGCKRTISIRGWWTLAHSVQSSYIQDP